MPHLRFVLFLFFVALCTSSFKESKSRVHKKAERSLKKSHPDFVHIPKGMWVYINRQQPWWQGKRKVVKQDTVIVEPFWMSKYEVSNAKWQVFVKDIGKRFGQDSAQKLLPDSTIWTDIERANFYMPMRRYYYRHRSYTDCPVLNVSVQQCEAYCEWLAESIRTSNAGKYLASVEVRLPTEWEWEHAACGGRNSLYPWGTDYLRDSKGKSRANYRELPVDWARKRGGKIRLEVDYEPADVAMIPAPVDLYESNDFGLYQMGGNAAEFVVASTDTSAAEGQGITCGGSFFDPPYYMKCRARDYYAIDSSAHFTRGFRPVLTFKLKEGFKPKL